MKLPVYEIQIDLNDDTTGMSAISLVTDPATESNFIYFSKNAKPMTFKVENEMEHKVTGCAIWANKQIYRYDPTIGEYYVVFTPDTIQKIVQKYAKEGMNNLVDLQHDGKMVDGVVMVEYYIKDTTKGIDPKGFEDIDDGSLFVTYKIENEELWNEIISPDSEFKGFSIEINAEIKPTDNYVEVEDEEDEDFWGWLAGLLGALEDEGCEVLFDSDKDKWLVNGDGEYWLDENGNKVPAKCPKCGADVGVYIKGEPVFLCSECGEYLGTVKFPDDEMFSVDVKKKSEFKVDRSDVSKQIKKAVKVDGTDYWVYGIGKRDGENVAILYNPETKEYDVKKLNEIKKWVPLKDKPGTFPALPDRIVDDPQITVQKTIISNEIPDIMHNHILAQLSYNDEQPNPHAGFRQVAIVAHGLTKAGNRCFRAYELFGDSRSAAEGEAEIPGWRLFLESRVVSLKSMTGTQPYTKEWLGGLSPKYNWQGDKSMEPCTDHLTEADFLN